MAPSLDTTPRSRVWGVGALCKAVADALDARFNPVAVRGELMGFTRAASGHCYFVIKDREGQLRCAMFRRAASMLVFQPRDGEVVEVRGRVSVFEARGELQLVVESMAQVGQGDLFEQFLRLKAKLQAEGLFDAARKRELPAFPRAIGVVTSLGAAALHDVVTTLQRRAPQVHVLIAPSSVQGAAAVPELRAAVKAQFDRVEAARAAADTWAGVAPEVLLLVRGGGAMEDLWAFNDESLVRLLATSPIPVVSGVGHETDFTLCDFVADLRAPTPTAAAELASPDQRALLRQWAQWLAALQTQAQRRLDLSRQDLDRLQGRLGRPSQRLNASSHQLTALRTRLAQTCALRLDRRSQTLDDLHTRLTYALRSQLQAHRERQARMQLRLDLMDPHAVLQRGYAFLTDAEGQVVTSAAQVEVGQALQATLADGRVDLQVTPTRRA